MQKNLYYNAAEIVHWANYLLSFIKRPSVVFLSSFSKVFFQLCILNLSLLDKTASRRVNISVPGNTLKSVEQRQVNFRCQPSEMTWRSEITTLYTSPGSKVVFPSLPELAGGGVGMTGYLDMRPGPVLNRRVVSLSRNRPDNGFPSLR